MRRRRDARLWDPTGAPEGAAHVAVLGTDRQAAQADGSPHEVTARAAAADAQSPHDLSGDPPRAETRVAAPDPGRLASSVVSPAFLEGYGLLDEARRRAAPGASAEAARAVAAATASVPGEPPARVAAAVPAGIGAGRPAGIVAEGPAGIVAGRPARSERVAVASRVDDVREGHEPQRRARSTSPRAQLRRGERLPMRRDRRGEILERLGRGPASAHELAESFGISREGVLRWLRLLEADGLVKATASARTSRENRWVLAGD